MAAHTKAPFWQSSKFWFSLALLFRLLYLLETGFSSVLFYQPLLDEAEVINTANQILNGYGFGPEPLFKAPFYALFLSAVIKLTGHHFFWVARLIQHILGALLIFIIFDIFKQIGTKDKERLTASILASFILAFYGPLIRLENRLVLDFFTFFFQSLMIWCFIRCFFSFKKIYLWALSAGCLGALAWLNRPTIMLSFIPLAILLSTITFLSFRRIKTMLMTLLFFLIPIILSMSAVYLRNDISAKEAMLLPWQGGFNFYQANKIGTTGRYLKQDSFTFIQSGNPTKKMMIDEYKKTNPLKKISHTAINHFWYKKATLEIKNNIALWGKLMGEKIIGLFTVREIYNFESYKVQQKISFLLPYMFCNFGLIFPFALASIALFSYSTPKEKSLYLLLWLYSSCYGLSVALFFISGRFRMPLVFPILLLSSIGIPQFIHLKEVNKRSKLLYIILFLIGIAICFGDWNGVRSEKTDYADYARLSNAAYRDGFPEKALIFIKEAEKEKPDYPTIPLLKAQAFFAQKKYKEAEHFFIVSLSQLKKDPVAPFNLGILYYYYLNKPYQAVNMFTESYRRKNNFHSATYMLILSLLRTHDQQSADKYMQQLKNNKNKKKDLYFWISQAAICYCSNKATKLSQLKQEIKQRFHREGLELLEKELTCFSTK